MNTKEYFSKSGMQTILSKLKELFDTKADASDIPSKLSELENDAGFASYTAGDNINISDDNVISATGGGGNASWTGTQAEWDALDKSTLEDGTQVNIIDDYTVDMSDSVVLQMTLSEYMAKKDVYDNANVFVELTDVADEVTEIVSVTEAEYLADKSYYDDLDALVYITDSEKVDTDVVSVTQSEYDANQSYYDGLDSFIKITDADGYTADDIEYESGSVADALDSTKWKLLKSFGTESSLTVPISAKEIKITVASDKSVYYRYTTSVISEELPLDIEVMYRMGHYNSSTDNSGATVGFKKTSSGIIVRIVLTTINGVTKTSNTDGTIYYK